jgi:lysophospholipase L1-like esterase
MRHFTLLLFLPLFLFCRHSAESPETMLPPPVQTTEKIDLLALGDSYTKGQGVAWNLNFPNQLADTLRTRGYELAGLHVVAQTGWRTDNLQAALAQPAQSNVLNDSVFSLVTLCIGVNNMYQNTDFETFKRQYEELLQYALQRAGQRKERVIVLSIPDWAFTPYGQGFGNPALISQKIDQYNAAKRSITESYGIAFVNVTDVSRRGLEMPELVASDQLHPSEKQYTEWVRLLLPVVKLD